MNFSGRKKERTQIGDGGTCARRALGKAPGVTRAPEFFKNFWVLFLLGYQVPK